MSFISVDRNRLERAATAIENYIKSHRSKMTSANNEVNALSRAAWQGADFNQFNTQWNRVNERSSTSEKMIASLDNYAKFLRNASTRYRNAQTNAINRASRI
ncbi:MAG: WXG100 family type VII secretion target [Oscillospiraceae bacterium]|nr:WXG100 family type VII secretion target [Oscillospiraceae bacterium]